MIRRIFLRFLYQWRRLNAQVTGIRLQGPGVLLDRGIDLSLTSTFFKNKRGTLLLGRDVKISKGVTIHCYGGNVKIEQNTFIGPNTIIYGHGDVSIGKDSLIAMGCKIISSNHAIPEVNIPINSVDTINGKISIGNDVWLGANVIVLAGVSIGKGSVVGAGSVVTKSLPENVIAVGNPAKIIKVRDPLKGQN